MTFHQTARKSPTRATSTKSKQRVPTTRSSSCQSAVGRAKKISTSPGSDSIPRYSPDGKSIAWRSQARGGYESDRFTLTVYGRASEKSQIATQDFDRSVGSFAWAPDSKTVYFSAEDHGEAPIYRLSLGEKQPTEVARLHADDLIFGRGGKVSLSHP